MTVPHPSIYLLYSIKQIQMAEYHLTQDIPPFEQRQTKNRQSAQARLLRIFVQLLDKTGLSNLDKSDAVWPIRLSRQDILVNPAEIASHCLTPLVARNAALWEAGVEGRSDDQTHFRQLVTEYNHAFNRVKTWVSSLVAAGIDLLFD